MAVGSVASTPRSGRPRRCSHLLHQYVAVLSYKRTVLITGPVRQVQRAYAGLCKAVGHGSASDPLANLSFPVLLAGASSRVSARAVKGPGATAAQVV